MKRRISIFGFFLSAVLVVFLLAAQTVPAFAGPDKQPAQTQVVSEQKKPWYKSHTAKIVGGSAGAGAGYLYDRKTRNKK